MSMNEIRRVVRHIISESEGRAVLDIDAYKPVVKKLLMSALEELQNERGAVLDAHLAQLESLPGGNPGGDRIKAAVSLRDEIAANPTKSVSAIVVLTNALRNKVSAVTSRTIGEEVANFESTSSWSPENQVSTAVAYLAIDLLDPFVEMSNKSIRVIRAVEEVLRITLNWILEAASDAIRSQVAAVSVDQPDFEDRISDIRKMISDFDGSIRLTTLEDGSSVSYKKRWLASRNEYLDRQIYMYRSMTRTRR
jgi:hypothetical protein